MNGKKQHVCNRCKHLHRAQSLFPELEIVECDNGVYKKLNIIPVGGGIKDEVENVSSMVSL